MKTALARSSVPTSPVDERLPPKRDTALFHLLLAAQFIYAGRVGGAEQMLYNLVGGLAELRANTTVLCSRAANLAVGFLNDVTTADRVTLREVGGRGPRFLSEQAACLNPSLAGDAILFPNYYLPPIRPRRVGMTGIVLHDLQYRHFPSYFSARKRAWLKMAQGFAVSRADRVFVISDFVRRDVEQVYGSRIARKLVVAPNPISWLRFGSADPNESSPIDRPYILSVAAQYPHKNLETLIRAFAELAQHDRDIHLVLCGQDYSSLHGVGGVKVGLRAVIDELGLGARVTTTGYLDDFALGRWYRHAAVFAFPSTFEGFGMPPVEALGFGLPVLTTGLTALPETTLGLAQTVDQANNVSEWASRLLCMLRQGSSGRLADVQSARVRHTYSPRMCAARYLAAFKPG